MSINTQIPAEQWQDFFVTFSNGNRGREIRLEVCDPASGETGPAQQGPLLAIAYDSAGRGDDLVITTGTDEIDYSHVIKSPTEVWRAQGDDGEIVALELINAAQVKSIVTLQ